MAQFMTTYKISDSQNNVIKYLTLNDVALCTYTDISQSCISADRQAWRGSTALQQGIVFLMMFVPVGTWQIISLHLCVSHLC